jgi:Na+/H+ antiporter NhaD/arsenite permease-like protein
VVVLLAVFLLTAVRQVVGFRLRIWQIMLGGALAVLLTGTISPERALRAIDPGVMLFLFAMFVVGEVLIESGYLLLISRRILSRAATADQLLLILILTFGVLSAFLMNDTIAIIGSGLVLGLAKRWDLPPKSLLLALAIAITTGSVMSPIGSPQNLLVAEGSGIAAPFTTFFAYLAIPTLINLGLGYMILRWLYRRELESSPLYHQDEVVSSPRLAQLAKASLCIIAVLITIKVIASFIAPSVVIPLPLIAACAALPVLFFSKERFTILKRIDWCTLVFFAAMFVLMASVWESGFFQSFLNAGTFSSVPIILGLSIVLSQFISNVPFVALFQPMILEAGGSVPGLMALAAGSTIAGNLTVLGAASNVIIIQNAERQGITLTFWEFLRFGLPVTAVNMLVYWVFLSLV